MIHHQAKLKGAGQMLSRLMFPALAALVLPLSGCLTMPPMLGGEVAASAPDAATGPEVGPVQMASGFNPILLDVIEEARRVAIYTQMNHIGDPQNAQLLFPVEVAATLGLTNSQMNRRFMDALLATKRFKVLDDGPTGGVQEGSRQRWGREMADIVVDCQVTDARQEIIDINPYRKVRTQVKVSVHMINRRNGENLFDGDVAVDGVWGDLQGEGTLLAPNVSLQSTDMQRQLGNDYERALTRAFTLAVERIDQLVRPVGRVTFADTAGLSMFGGIQQGFQGGDDIVVFRAHKRRLADGREVVFRIEALAEARCHGVGSSVSQCDLRRLRSAGEQIKDGDYTVLSDASAQAVRRR